jgi:glycosyltransferase involved in cell wall biosynthesis
MLAAALWRAGRREGLMLHLAGGDMIDAVEARYGYARFTVVRRLLRLTFRRSAIVKANSDTAATRARQLGCPIERLHIVPSNITSLVLPERPLADFRQRQRSELLAELGRPSGPLLLAVGRLSPIKGFDWIVRALPALVARWPTLTLVIVGPEVAGEATYLAHLRAAAAAAGLAANLQLVGPAPLARMRHYYAAADLLIVSSLVEGLNKAGLEAGANGTPTVVTSSTGLAAAIERSGAGLVIPPRDPVALAAAVTTLLTEPDRWAAASLAGPRLATEFSPAAVAQALLPLYAAAAPPDHPWLSHLSLERRPSPVARHQP